jgi:hypothetical protein
MTDHTNSEYVAAVASTFPQLIGYFISLINFVIPILMAGALFFYFYNSGINLYKGGAMNKEEMKGQLLWGAIILFCMVSVWGLVGFIQNTFYNLR